MTKTSTTFTLLILAIFGGGLAACAQSRLPPASPPSVEYRTAEEAGEEAAAAVDAAALAGVDAAEAAMWPKKLGEGENNISAKTRLDTTNPQPPRPPSGLPIPTDLLLNRILALVDSLRSPNDVTRAQVERMMDIKLAPDSEIENGWDYTGSTDAGWEYSVFVEDNRKEDLPSISIGFSSGESKSADGVACSYELETLSKRLTALGYERHPRWIQPRAHLLFQRETNEGRFGSSIHVFKYIWKEGAEQNGTVYCAENMNISAGIHTDGE